MGLRGIPANYGGFETFIEKMAPRLVKRGHRVTVYGRTNNIEYEKKYYKGVRIKLLPTISHKYFDTVVHTFLCSVHSMFMPYDIILMLNAANSPFACLPRLTFKKVALNVDGIERLRKKWGLAGRLYYRLGEYLATKCPDRIVSDAEVIREYYLNMYKKESVMIAYGAETKKVQTREILDKTGLDNNGYILYVSRLEPENNAHVVIEAFKDLDTDKKLVIVGDAPYSTKYINRIKEMAGSDKRIIFTGYIFGDGYRELQSNAYCYVQATEVGGTHPALIEAMGVGNCVIANGTSENIEVLADAGVIYRLNDPADLRIRLQQMINNPERVSEYAKKAQKRVMDKYSWESVTDKYEDLFFKMIGKRRK